MNNNFYIMFSLGVLVSLIIFTSLYIYLDKSENSSSIFEQNKKEVIK